MGSVELSLQRRGEKHYEWWVRDSDTEGVGKLRRRARRPASPKSGSLGQNFSLTSPTEV